MINFGIKLGVTVIFCSVGRKKWGPISLGPTTIGRSYNLRQRFTEIAWPSRSPGAPDKMCSLTLSRLAKWCIRGKMICPSFVGVWVRSCCTTCRNGIRCDLTSGIRKVRRIIARRAWAAEESRISDKTAIARPFHAVGARFPIEKGMVVLQVVSSGDT